MSKGIDWDAQGVTGQGLTGGGRYTRGGQGYTSSILKWLILGPRKLDPKLSQL